MGLPHLVGHLGCEDFGALVDKLRPEIPDGHRGTERPEDKRDGKEHPGHGEVPGDGLARPGDGGGGRHQRCRASSGCCGRFCAWKPNDSGNVVYGSR